MGDGYAALQIDQVDATLLKDYVVGLGGRDVTPAVLRGIYDDLLNLREGAAETEWVGLKRPEKELDPHA